MLVSHGLCWMALTRRTLAYLRVHVACVARGRYAKDIASVLDEEVDVDRMREVARESVAHRCVA